MLGSESSEWLWSSEHPQIVGRMQMVGRLAPCRELSVADTAQTKCISTPWVLPSLAISAPAIAECEETLNSEAVRQ